MTLSEVRLRELRKAAGITQEELGRRMGLSQSRVHLIEKAELRTLGVGTLRRYLAALDWELRVTARFPDGEVVELP